MKTLLGSSTYKYELSPAFFFSVLPIYYQKYLKKDLYEEIVVM
ncbi:hypothetical protein ASZ90_017718 [hydrocarbon metagenome]|uniref:Uncharacterized protein n=1 Tax=hydrocarbon metagenome TaxID=938273 RepID=A0A0W8E8V8_9ZZZZ